MFVVELEVAEEEVEDEGLARPECLRLGGDGGQHEYGEARAGMAREHGEARVGESDTVKGSWERGGARVFVGLEGTHKRVQDWFVWWAGEQESVVPERPCLGAFSRVCVCVQETEGTGRGGKG